MILPAVRTRFLYNRTLPRAGTSFPQPAAGDFPRTTFKNAHLERVRSETTDDVGAVLDAVPLGGRHRWVAVDVKVDEIVPGECPCIPGWHADTLLDPFHESEPEVHHIFVSGHASLTEFVGAPVELEVGPAASPRALLADLNRQLAEIDPPVHAIPSATLVAYGRFHLHRGALGKARERRLLVRVTETSVVEPSSSRRR